jgi:hypothetical protein
MHRRLASSLALVALTAAGCIVPENQKPSVGLGGTFATRYVHRGMTLVDNPVVQPKLAVELPLVTGDALGVDVEGSMDLRNDTGGAWFPDGHAGRFTQVEMQVAYSKTIGDVSLLGGVHTYIVPNGLEFPNGERGETKEVFVIASTTVLDARPYVAMHYDYDEVRGAYYRGGIREDIPLGTLFDRKLQLDLDGSVGYVSEAQGAWMYGLGESGFADLRGEAVLSLQYDARTRISIGMHGSLILDDTIDDWFSQLGIDDDPIWFTAGVAWSF